MKKLLILFLLCFCCIGWTWNSGWKTDLSTNVNDAGDVDITGIATGKIMKWNATTAKWEMSDDAGASSGAPTDADYLVGTANGSLSAEVVVSANGKSLVTAVNYAAMKTLLDTDDIQTLTGIAAGTAHLGTFTGSTIADSQTIKAAFQALETAVEGKQSTVTEGSLADSVVVSDDIKDGTIVVADTAITAGRSLTWSTNDIAADAELYTSTKCLYLEDPTADDDLKSIWYAKTAYTITSLWCESDQTVTAMLQVDDGSPADVDGTDLTCDSTPPEDTSLDGDATLAAGDRLDLDVASVSGTPTWVSICFTVTADD